MMTSLIERYYQAFLAQGVCFGIGAGMIFVPSLAVVSTYFVKHRSFALGVAISGSSLGEQMPPVTSAANFLINYSGGVIYPTLFRSLQPRIGFGWTTRIIGLVALLTLGFANIVMRQRALPAARRRLFDASALREAPYIFCTAGLFFGFIGLYIPFFYITPYAHLKTGAGETLAFYFVPILNAASIFGRLIPNAMADRVGPLNMFVPSALACAVLAFTWIAVHSTGGLLVFAILYGFFSGSFVSLPPSSILSLSSDLENVGTRLGMSFSVAGFGILIGSPVGGALLNLDTGRFVRAQVFCAVVLTVSGASLVLARVTKVGCAVSVKA
jgi:predicted MFS family arabinose efflux permease